MTRPTRDQLYLQMAELVSIRGTCPRRAVGCVLVDVRGRVLATGYNGVASGRPHCNEGFPCPGAHYPSGQGLDKCEAIHAEQNAILLLRDPWSVDTVYVTTTPCLSCVKLLLGTSARRLVCRDLYPHAEALEWWARAGREFVHLNEFLETDQRRCRWYDLQTQPALSIHELTELEKLNGEFGPGGDNWP